MTVISQPKNVDDLLSLVRRYDVDPKTWLKKPEALLQELRDLDVRFEETEYGLTTVRSAVLVEVYYFTEDMRWMEMYEDRQEIVAPDGSVLRTISRQDEFEGLRETWQHLHESERTAVTRCLLQEGGFSRIVPDRLFRRTVVPAIVVRPSRFYLGLWSQRRISRWEYLPPKEDINQNGNVELDEEKGVKTHFSWRVKRCDEIKRVAAASLA